MIKLANGIGEGTMGNNWFTNDCDGIVFPADDIFQFGLFFLVEPNFDLKLIDTTLHCCKGMEGVKKTLCTNGQMAAFKSKRKQFFIKKRKLAFFIKFKKI